MKTITFVFFLLNLGLCIFLGYLFAVDDSWAMPFIGMGFVCNFVLGLKNFVEWRILRRSVSDQ